MDSSTYMTLSMDEAIISLSAKEPDKAVTREMIKNEKPLDLDAEYEEEPVTFGGGACNTDR